MKYLNLSYTPGLPPVYDFTMTTDFGVDIDVTGSTWTFEVFDCYGKSLYLNTTPLTQTGNVVSFTIPNPVSPAVQVLIEGNYAYRVVGANSSTHASTVAYKGFLTVEPTYVLPS